MKRIVERIDEVLNGGIQDIKSLGYIDQARLKKRGVRV